METIHFVTMTTARSIVLCCYGIKGWQKAPILTYNRYKDVKVENAQVREDVLVTMETITMETITIIKITIRNNLQWKISMENVYCKKNCHHHDNRPRGHSNAHIYQLVCTYEYF